jgi:hypothetical protein
MSYQEEHHVWCNDFNSNRKGCVECTRLFKKYPDVRWENVHERANYYFGGRHGTEQSRKNS